MSIKVLIRENKSLLLEVTLEQVEERFKSKKFLRVFSEDYMVSDREEYYPEIDATTYEEFLVDIRELFINQVPEDVPEKDKAESLNWLLSYAIKSKSYYFDDDIPGLLPDVFENFYLIKNSGQSRFLNRKSLVQISNPKELYDVVQDAMPKYLKWDEERQGEEFAKNGGDEGVNHILKDHPDWDVFIPETQLAARFLGRGTSWCTATNPKTSRNYYSTYHTEKSPLYIFIKKQDPVEKYQFSYLKMDFADRYNRGIEGKPIFYLLNDLIKNIGAPKITIYNLREAGEYNYEDLGEGLIKTSSPGSIIYKKDGELHREDGPAVVDYIEGVIGFYLNGEEHELGAYERLTGYDFADYGKEKKESQINEGLDRIRKLSGL